MTGQKFGGKNEGTGCDGRVGGVRRRGYRPAGGRADAGARDATGDATRDLPGPQATPTASPQAATQGAQPFTAAQLDQLLAPIALYPDALLAQTLMAASYALEVVEAARWSKDKSWEKADLTPT